jgi:hypothetical protein
VLPEQRSPSPDAREPPAASGNALRRAEDIDEEMNGPEAGLNWAQRNAGFPVLEPRSKPNQRARTGEEKKIASEVRRKKALELKRDLGELQGNLDEGMKKLAEGHGYSVSRVRNLFYHGATSHLKKAPEVSLANAIISHKAQELNAGKSAQIQYANSH